MKQTAILLGVLGVLFCICATDIHAQITNSDNQKNSVAADKAFGSLRDSLLRKYTGSVVKDDTKGKNSICELHAWFDRKLTDLQTQYYGDGFRLSPLGIYSTRVPQDSARIKKWNFGAEYHLPLNTINGFFTAFSPNLFNPRAFARVFLGGGIGNISGLKAPATEVTSNWGVNGELVFENKERLWLNPLIGLSYVWVNPKLGSDGQGNYLYAGNRLYFSSKRTLSLDLRGGVAFWRGFDEETPPAWFFGGGLTIHKDVDFAKAGKPLFAPPEVGLIGNAPLSLISGKVMFPMRFWKGISLAPFGSYGAETGSNPYSAASGLGAEIRLFGDDKNAGLNPYAGFQHYWLHQFPGTGKGFSFYFGARLYLTDYIALDGNTGPVFWKEDTPEDKNLKDWVAQIGFTVSFGKVRENKDLSGAVLIQKNEWGKSPYDQKANGRLDEKGLHRYDGEVRVYAADSFKAGTVIDTVIDTVIVIDSSKCPTSAGDLTDLKFYTLNLDFDLAMDPFNTQAGLLSEAKGRDKDIFIAILFNKKHTVVSNLNETNTFFHFVDLDNCQYFGYRWDANRSRQPEYEQHDALGIIGDNYKELYWGNFNEFVKPVSWLDKKNVMDFINGSSMQDKILQVLSRQITEEDSLFVSAPTPEDSLKLISKNFRIGYVKYPQSTIAKLEGFLYYRYKSLGAAVMYCADRNSNGLFVKARDTRWMGFDSIPPGIDSEAIVRFDPVDDFSFSNHVKMKGILSQSLALDQFVECDSEPSALHEQILKDSVLSRLRANPGLTISICGYTDATRMTDTCFMMNGGQMDLRDSIREDRAQKHLSEARAQHVKNYLTRIGIRDEQIKETKGMGIKWPYRNRMPEDRCVIIEFID